ncbi:dihydroneopterin aldolase [Halioxenophilus sp. WMMB6]|uniref:dihydroneopterin aldolase n=1 Tax=Halioxenophilus sp. WMMB6 TaxID=3073815 RepID=UPI00295EB1AF|nr:dihydroneopterin aldolase [Halioxenophilus sp. WMMB6]
MSVDKVFIDDLGVETVIGIYPWEQQVKQMLSVSLAMGWDIRQAAESDDIARTLNYAEVAEYIQLYANEHTHLLLESFVEDLAARLINRFGLPWVRIRVAKKSTVPRASQVGVEIERSAAK